MRDGEVQAMGNVLTQDDPWLLHRIRKELPVLVRSNSGDVFSMKDREKELLNTGVAGDDLYIVDAHGEIVSAVAEGLRSKLWTQRGLLYQVDSHLDHEIYRPHEDEVPERKVGTAIVRRKLNALLAEPDPKKQQRLFEQIISETRGDIDTFVFALGNHFDVAAVVRPEEEERFVSIDARDVQRYTEIDVSLRGRLPTDPDSAIRQHRENIQVMSVDGDIAGVERATSRAEKFNAFLGYFEAFHTRMNRVLQGLGQLDGRSSRQPILYTLSLDPEWVRYPELFFQRFMREFYVPMLQRKRGTLSACAPSGSKQSATAGDGIRQPGRAG